MTGLEEIAKPWTDSQGKTRWYVNDWFKYIGITKKVECHSSCWWSYRAHGTRRYKVISFHYEGEKLREWWVCRYIKGTKVWIDEDLKVHVRMSYEKNTDKYNPIPDLEVRITQAIQDVVYCYA